MTFVEFLKEYYHNPISNKRGPHHRRNSLLTGKIGQTRTRKDGSTYTTGVGAVANQHKVGDHNYSHDKQYPVGMQISKADGDKLVQTHGRGKQYSLNHLKTHGVAMGNSGKRLKLLPNERSYIIINS